MSVTSTVTVTFNGSSISVNPNNEEMKYGVNPTVYWVLNNTSGQSAKFSNVYFLDTPHEWPGNAPTVNNSTACVDDPSSTTETITYEYGINIAYGSNYQNVMCLDPPLEREPG